jgi:hypothetical protein
MQISAMHATPHVLHALRRKINAHHAIIIGKRTKINFCLMVSAWKNAQVVTTRTLGIISVRLLNSKLGQEVLFTSYSQF